MSPASPTPWVAGDWVFVATDEAKVIAMARTTGKIRWIAELPRWEKPKDKKGPIFYSGPILAGQRLILTGSNGTYHQRRSGDRLRSRARPVPGPALTCNRSSRVTRFMC